MLNVIKKIASILVICAVLCVLAGCGSNVSTASEFDFDAAMKDISLFGQKISLPCYWSDLSEDFSHKEVYFPSDDDLMCALCYKGKEIGMIAFGNCPETEDASVAESHQIVCIILGFTDYEYPYSDHDRDFLDRLGYYTGEMEFALGDVSMSSTESEIIAALGEPSRISGGDSRYRYLDYKYDSGYLHFVITTDRTYKGIMQLYIGVYSN